MQSERKPKVYLDNEAVRKAPEPDKRSAFVPVRVFWRNTYAVCPDPNDSYRSDRCISRLQRGIYKSASVHFIEPALYKTLRENYHEVSSTSSDEGCYESEGSYDDPVYSDDGYITQ